MELHDHIWNQYEKCIQIITNMTGISSLICDIDIKISRFSESNKVLLNRTNAHGLSVNKSMRDGNDERLVVINKTC